MNRTTRLGNVIGTFLHEEVGAVRLEGHSRIGDKMRVLWSLRDNERWGKMSAAERARHCTAAREAGGF